LRKCAGRPATPGNEEAEAMLRILETQRKQIEAKQRADTQLVFETMLEEDRRQREAEHRFQTERLNRLPENWPRT